MEISAWINLSLSIVALIGVGVALFIGIRSIRESRNLQIIQYKIELLEKVSDWLANIQTCLAEDYIPEGLYSVKQSSLSSKIALSLNFHKRGSTFSNVLEEGRNILGIANIFNKRLCEVVKSLETDLQNTTESFIKYSKIINDTSINDDLAEAVAKLDEEYLNNMKSIHESTSQLMGEIFSTRISLFDSISFGSDPFKDIS